MSTPQERINEAVARSRLVHETLKSEARRLRDENSPERTPQVDEREVDDGNEEQSR